MITIHDWGKYQGYDTWHTAKEFADIDDLFVGCKAALAELTMIVTFSNNPSETIAVLKKFGKGIKLTLLADAESSWIYYNFCPDTLQRVTPAYSHGEYIYQFCKTPDGTDVLHVCQGGEWGSNSGVYYGRVSDFPIFK